MVIQPCPGCAATNQVQLERIAALKVLCRDLEVRLKDALEDARVTSEKLGVRLAERDAWIDTANQHCRNEQFYHGLLTAVGKLFGDAAKRQDDGGLCEDVLALRVHECVVAALTERDEARAEAQALRTLFLDWEMLETSDGKVHLRSDIKAAIDAARSAMPGSAPTED